MWRTGWWSNLAWLEWQIETLTLTWAGMAVQILPREGFSKYACNSMDRDARVKPPLKIEFWHVIEHCKSRFWSVTHLIFISFWSLKNGVRKPFFCKNGRFWLVCPDPNFEGLNGCKTENYGELICCTLREHIRKSNYNSIFFTYSTNDAFERTFYARQYKYCL